MQLKDKVVIVTGSSSGIGREVALQFSKEGAKVVVNCKSNIERGKETVDKIKKSGGDAILVQADVSEPTDVKKLFDLTLKKYKTVNILINNAGRAYNVEFEKASKIDWLKSFNDNFFGTVLCSKEAVKIMKQKGGRIINTASIMGLDYMGRTGIMAYSAAKAAVINFTKTLAKQVAPDILVNAIAPGRTYTPYYDTLEKQMVERLKNMALVKRFVNVSEIADTFIYIARNDALTGSVIVVDLGVSVNI